MHKIKSPEKCCCTIRPVNIVWLVVWQGVVDHEGQAPDVDTPGRHICADKKTRLRNKVTNQKARRRTSNQSETAPAKKRPIKKHARWKQRYAAANACDQWESARQHLTTTKESTKISNHKACQYKQGSITAASITPAQKAANKKACLQTLGPIRKHLY